jgi:hypothetical protein
MKHGLLNGIACSSLLFFALAAGNAAAQTYHDDDNWHHARESYFTGDNWRMHLFERVRADLDHVQTDAFAGSDQYRIVQTKQQVAELQAKLTEGKYDQPELDEVIAGLQRVIADNRLTARDRDMLNDDMARVRDYRAHHEDWH